jgi:hypothetical protein
MWRDPQHGTFAGSINITVNITAPRGFILVHKKDITVPETRLTWDAESGQTEDVVIATPIDYELHDFWITRTTEVLQVGCYKLYMTFKGDLTKTFEGFYTSNYKNENGELK